MFSHMDTQARQIISGNILMIACCILYLIWWLVAFHPTHAVKGIRSGWILIPALIFGVVAVVQIIRGAVGGETNGQLMPKLVIAGSGALIYLILLLISYILLKRQVTTELLLLVGWATLMFLEMNALYAHGYYSLSSAIIFLVFTVFSTGIGIVCYLLYYNLNSVEGYVDGMIPLILSGVVMIGISVDMIFNGARI